MTCNTRVLFICMGNICRSPTAEGVFREKVRLAGLADRVSIDSAGTHNYHPGEAPDARSQRHAKARGYDISDLRARVLRAEDFERFDLMVVMDEANFATVRARLPEDARSKLRRMMEFSAYHSARRALEVPDPYYGEAADFERVLDMVEAASEGLVAHVRAQIQRADSARPALD